MKEVVIKYLRDIYYVSENLNYKHSCYCPLLLTSLRTNIRQIIIITICIIFNDILNVSSLYFSRVFVKIFSDPKVAGDYVNKYDILIGFLYLLIRFTHYILQRKITHYLNG